MDSLITRILSFLIFIALNISCKKDCAGDTAFTKFDYSGSASLSEPRALTAGVASGNKIYFAGGLNIAGSKTVDDYDVTKDAWSALQLSAGRGYMAAGAPGNKVVFKNSGCLHT